MEDKIYEIIKEKNAKTAGMYMKYLGIIDDEDSVKSGIPKKNIDLLIILSNIGLIGQNPETGDLINEFHDYLYKLGISVGIGHGKRMIIESIREYPDSFENIMEIDPEDFVNYNIEPTFIQETQKTSEISNHILEGFLLTHFV